jgi:hypothetical protein
MCNGQPIAMDLEVCGFAKGAMWLLACGWAIAFIGCLEHTRREKEGF